MVGIGIIGDLCWDLGPPEIFIQLPFITDLWNHYNVSGFL